MFKKLCSIAFLVVIMFIAACENEEEPSTYTGVRQKKENYFSFEDYFSLFDQYSGFDYLPDSFKDDQIISQSQSINYPKNELDTFINRPSVSKVQLTVPYSTNTHHATASKVELSGVDYNSKENLFSDESLFLMHKRLASTEYLHKYVSYMNAQLKQSDFSESNDSISFEVDYEAFSFLPEIPMFDVSARYTNNQLVVYYNTFVEVEHSDQVLTTVNDKKDTYIKNVSNEYRINIKITVSQNEEGKFILKSTYYLGKNTDIRFLDADTLQFLDYRNENQLFKAYVSMDDELLINTEYIKTEDLNKNPSQEISDSFEITQTNKESHIAYKVSSSHNLDANDKETSEIVELDISGKGTPESGYLFVNEKSFIPDSLESVSKVDDLKYVLLFNHENELLFTGIKHDSKTMQQVTAEDSTQNKSNTYSGYLIDMRLISGWDEIVINGDNVYDIRLNDQVIFSSKYQADAMHRITTQSGHSVFEDSNEVQTVCIIDDNSSKSNYNGVFINLKSSNQLDLKLPGELKITEPNRLHDLYRQIGTVKSEIEFSNDRYKVPGLQETY